MSKKLSSVGELIELFEDYIDEDDILSAKILSQISSAIVKYRVEHGMSQKEFAEFLDVSQAMVSKIESADYNFSIKKLVHLCNKMGLYLNVNLKNSKARIQQNNYSIKVVTYGKFVIEKENFNFTTKENKKIYSTNNNVGNSYKWIN